MDAQLEPLKDNLQKLCILLVDDDRMNQFVARTFLVKKWGCQVTTANNGKEALEILRSEKFHIILMDTQMPEMDGAETTRNIRALTDVSVNATPIFAYSSAVESKEKAEALGMTDFTAKPINPEDLFLKVAHYVLGASDSSLPASTVTKNLKQKEADHESAPVLISIPQQLRQSA